MSEAENWRIGVDSEDGWLTFWHVPCETEGIERPYMNGNDKCNYCGEIAPKAIRMFAELVFSKL